MPLRMSLTRIIVERTVIQGGVVSQSFVMNMPAAPRMSARTRSRPVCVRCDGTGVTAQGLMSSPR